MPPRRIPAFEPGERFYTVAADFRLVLWVVTDSGEPVTVPPRVWKRTDNNAEMKAEPYRRVS